MFQLCVKGNLGEGSKILGPICPPASMDANIIFCLFSKVIVILCFDMYRGCLGVIRLLFGVNLKFLSLHPNYPHVGNWWLCSFDMHFGRL